MRNTKKKIDGQKFKQAFKKRGLTFNDVSEELGHNRYYIAQIKVVGEISEASIKMLQALYNIQPEEYLSYEEEKKGAGVFNYDDVAEGLKQLRATNDALNETMDDIRYVLNVLARDLKEIKYELIPEREDDSEEPEQEETFSVF